MDKEALHPLDYVVKELLSLTMRLDNLSRMVILSTLMHVALAFLCLMFILTREGYGMRAFNTAEVSTALLLTDVFLLGLCVMSLVRFERLAKRGEAYFSEIANEKNWHGEDEDRLRFEYRIALREFSLASELPLARGKAGVSVYLLINVATTMVIWGALLLSIRQNEVF